MTVKMASAELKKALKRSERAKEHSRTSTRSFPIGQMPAYWMIVITILFLLETKNT